MNRAIWDDPNFSDKEKVDCLKWSNELVHRIWNISFELKRNEDDKSVERLWENIKFYGEQASNLKQHIQPTLLLAFSNFNALS